MSLKRHATKINRSLYAIYRDNCGTLLKDKKFDLQCEFSKYWKALFLPPSSSDFTFMRVARLRTWNRNKLNRWPTSLTNLFLEGRCSAEFSSNPNQTHLKQLIKLLLSILETSRQVCWGKLELNSAEHRPSRIKFGDPYSARLVTHQLCLFLFHVLNLATLMNVKSEEEENLKQNYFKRVP